MKDGRVFYIEVEGYDEKPELEIMIGVDIFVNEKGEILAEIPNGDKENFRDFQPNRDDNDEEIDLEISINHSLLENSEIEFKVSASNKKGKAEDVWVNTYFPNGYQIFDVTNELGVQTQELIKWKESNYSEWNVGTLEQDEERIMLIKAKKLSDKDEKGFYRNFNFKADILSYHNKERNMKNNNKIVGNRVFVVKLGDNRKHLIDTDAPFAGIKRKDVKEVERLLIGSREDVKIFDANENYIYDNCIQIIGERAIRQKMVEIVKKDDGEGGKKGENNREYGGYVTSKGEVIENESGEIANSSTQQYVSIALTSININVVTNFHSHPSGNAEEEKNNQVGAVAFGIRTEEPSKWKNAPSNMIIDNEGNKIGDIYNAKEEKKYGNVIRYVFARRNKMVYMYNKDGVLAVLPHEYFIEFKQTKK